jgi:hypothetical protein
MEEDESEAMEVEEHHDAGEDEDGELMGQDKYPIEYPPVAPQVMRAVRTLSFCVGHAEQCSTHQSAIVATHNTAHKQHSTVPSLN